MTPFTALDFVGVDMTHSALICAISEFREEKAGKKAPPSEWPFNSPATMDRIALGLQQAKEGKVKYLGSFAEHADE